MTVVAEVQDGQEGQPSEFLWHGSAQLEIPERESAIEVREFPDVRRDSAYRNGTTGGKTERVCQSSAVALKAGDQRPGTP